MMIMMVMMMVIAKIWWVSIGFIDYQNNENEYDDCNKANATRRGRFLTSCQILSEFKSIN